MVTLARRAVAWRITQMLTQMTIGTMASVCNIVVHSLTMSVVLKVTRSQRHIERFNGFFLSRLMSVVVCVLMAAHLSEIIIWALTYRIVGAVPTGSDFLYFAFVNYTTLGYGDITPVERWRLLGPVTAMNGIILFGWSTAVIFEVLRRTLIRMDELVH